MNQKPYHAYHGRQRWGRQVLVAIVVLLVIALAVALVGLLVLPNYVVYDANGAHLELPFLSGGQGKPASPPPAASLPAEEDPVVVETPSPTPSSTPSPTPTPDLSAFPRRDAPLGLVAYGEGKTLGSRQGFLFTADQAEGFTPAICQEEHDYVAVYLDADAMDAEALSRACLDLAGRAVDELVLSQADLSQVEETALAGTYTLVRQALDDAGFQGRLSVVVGRALFTDDTLAEGLLPCVAAKFDRVYASNEDSWSGLNIYQILKADGMGFQGSTADIVTVVNKPISAKYAWAVLP